MNTNHPQEIIEAGTALAEAVTDEMALEIRKAEAKSAAIQRLIGSENPETGKPHSASSAEKVVETDFTYRDFLHELRGATYRKIVARAKYDAAVAASRLATMEVAA